MKLSSGRIEFWQSWGCVLSICHRVGYTAVLYEWIPRAATSLFFERESACCCVYRNERTDLSARTVVFINTYVLIRTYLYIEEDQSTCAIVRGMYYIILYIQYYTYVCMPRVSYKMCRSKHGSRHAALSYTARQWYLPRHPLRGKKDVDFSRSSDYFAAICNN